MFKEDCETIQVYEARTKEIVAAAVRGFNGTVFAYGQTNSGKTHTMRGSPAEPGVIPLSVSDLFEITQQDTSREFLLRMSYLEIYNEDIIDLLAPEHHRKLQIHENLEVIESSQKTQDDDAVRVSVLNLVDLAGSERASKTGAEGVRLKEGSHINKSLMTLGTVIKKLSEGVDNQGGHIPYRDSKLTRILQPALGGNANTAIICNITLAQNHADETKSSLKFASRALRVTNCAHVNEISSDVALLKRKKKEIEELRSKPKSELERERIAMELDEEKKAQAQREKVLQEQAKKIENLSSIVLFSNRDEKREQEDRFKKGKRRDTWGTGLLSRDSSTSEVQSHGLSRERFERETGPLLPFAELVKSERLCSISEQDENSIDEDSALPDPCALVHVTRRKKPSSIRQKKPVMIITNQIQIECLKARVFGNVPRDESSVHLRDPEDIRLIKQLQEKINMLETEKSSSKQNLDDLVTVATEQNTCASQKIAEMLSDESEKLDLTFFNQRQRRVLWTPEEEEMLKVGVETFATDPKKNIPWKRILKMGENVFHQTRNPADLKDKWRRHNPSH
uniref:Kinesin-like protein n=1 Tax=Brassica campestris TaxID=3711 RepID=A0A3P6D5N1_BRACM|nr:unnamed protein product [Brassica rapa]